VANFLWTQKQDIGPLPRHRSEMAFDAARGRIVLFGGGTASSVLADTWEWDGNAWTQTADIGPAGRYAPALVYDDNPQRILLYGGRNMTKILADKLDRRDTQ
jgi:hypothetical protein